MSDSAEPKKPASRPFPWLLVGGCAVFGMFAFCCVGGWGTWFVFDRFRDAQTKRIENVNNLKKIGHALHEFHDQFKQLPAAAIVNPKAEQPLLSWRVAILPHLNEHELAKSIRMDESWDSEHNRGLWTKMPKVFQMPGKPNDGKTYYQGFRGANSIFHDNRIGTKIANITDGTSNTIMVVEAAESVNWMKPDDVPFRLQQIDLMKHLGNHWGDDTFCALFADGTVQRFKRSMPASTLEALVTRNGNEIADPSLWEVRR